VAKLSAEGPVIRAASTREDEVIRILLADDNQFVRTALVELFHSTGDIAVVAQCDDGEQVGAAAEQATPDVVILDLAMPSRTGLEAARDLLSVDPEARIILLTGEPSAAAVTEAREIGLAGYILKGEDPAELIQHVRTVAAGGTAWSSTVLTSGLGDTGTDLPKRTVSDYGERRHRVSAALKTRK
jgi:DNA-binding NarL/FixJ family response regulator